MLIRRAQARDAEILAEIYNGYILNTTITFEEEAITVQEMEKSISEKLLQYDWLIAEIEGKVIGYAYYGSFRARAAYKHTVESTVYLAKDFIKKGFGRELYSALIDSARNKGFREMIGVIAMPNPESIQLHSKLGFIDVGVMRKIGFKMKQYLDVAFMQKSLT